MTSPSAHRVRVADLAGLLVAGLCACGGNDAAAPSGETRAFRLAASPADGLTRAAADLLRQGRPRGALALLRRAAAADSQSAAVHYNTGVALMRISDLAAAEAAFRRAHQEDPDDPQVLLGLSSVLRAGHRDRQAVPLLRRAVGLAPARIDLRFELARALVEVGEAAAALAHLDSALALDAGHVPSRYWRGHLRLHMGRAHQALNDLEGAVALAPDHVLALLDLGSAYVELGRPLEALDVLRRVRDLDPRNSRVLYGLARVHQELGQPAARDSLLRLFDHLRRSVELFEEGRRMAALGDEDAALAAWRRATAADSTFAGALVESGRAWLRRGLLDSAQLAFETALDRTPDAVGARVGLARTHLEAGRPEPALELARGVLAVQGEHNLAHYYAGLALVRTGHLQEAEIHLRRVVELRPEFADGHRALSQVLELRGDEQAAQRHQERARVLEPEDAPADEGLATTSRP